MVGCRERVVGVELDESIEDRTCGMRLRQRERKREREREKGEV